MLAVNATTGALLPSWFADPTGFVVENATAMIWRLLLVAEKHFRKIDAPHLAAAVYRGVVFEDGVKLTKPNQRVAA